MKEIRKLWNQENKAQPHVVLAVASTAGLICISSSVYIWNKAREAQSLISILAVILAASSLWVSYSIYQNQITHFAWGRLSTHMPGNSGIGGALNFLYDKGDDIRFIDLRPFGQAYAADAEPEVEENLARVLSVDLSDADLSGSWLDNTHFNQSRFVGTILKNVRAQDSIFENVDFTGATLEEGIFSGAVLRDATVVATKAQYIDLTEATAVAIEFDKSDMAHAILASIKGQYSSYKEVDFSEALLVNGQFAYSMFQDADLSGAYLYDANFQGVNLSGVHFMDAKGLESVDFQKSWVWSDQLPVVSGSGKDFVKKYGIAMYDGACREDWLQRIENEKPEVMKQRVDDSSSLYRPPDVVKCMVD